MKTNFFSFINEMNVDIFVLPRGELKNYSELTIGDLHGNTIKLLFTLIKEGFVEIDKSSYQELIRIYRLPIHKIDFAQLLKFQENLNKITFKNTSRLVRLIGDEVADRGKLDYFTLLLFKKMIDNKVPFEIILSNHGFEFVSACEEIQLLLQSKFQHQLLNEFNSSMTRLNRVSSIDKTFIIKLYNEIYIPRLKLLSYTLKVDKTAIIIFSHAPLDLSRIQKAASILKVNYDDGSAVELAKTIDHINEAFSSIVRIGNVGGLLLRYNFFCDFIWNKDGKNLDIPRSKNGYELYFVHGHTAKCTPGENVWSVDSELGKESSRTGDEKNVGKYKIFCCTNRIVPHQEYTGFINKNHVFGFMSAVVTFLTRSQKSGDKTSQKTDRWKYLLGNISFFVLAGIVCYIMPKTKKGHFLPFFDNNVSQLSDFCGTPTIVPTN